MIVIFDPRLETLAALLIAIRIVAVVRMERMNGNKVKLKYFPLEM